MGNRFEDDLERLRARIADLRPQPGPPGEAARIDRSLLELRAHLAQLREEAATLHLAVLPGDPLDDPDEEAGA